jgi:hypothetical protein
MLTRRNTKPLHRTRLAKTFQPTVPTVASTASIVSTKVRVVCAQAYTSNGIPHFTVQGVAPTAITNVNATTFDLTYAVTPVTTNVFIIDANDPAIRFANGGYLAAGQTTF